MEHRQTQFSGGLGSVQLMTELDLEGLFQPKQVYESMILLLLKNRHFGQLIIFHKYFYEKV